MYSTINVQALLPLWLKSQQGDAPCVIVDVRENNEYAQAHIAGCLHIPLQGLPNAKDQIPQDQPVYMICHAGMRSAQAAQWLAQHEGYTQLVNVEGGMMAWIHADQAVEQG
jgi:rhodanese-related sulfurtransferase